MTRHELLCLMTALMAAGYDELDDAVHDAFVLEGAVKGVLESIEKLPRLEVVEKRGKGDGE